MSLRPFLFTGNIEEVLHQRVATASREELGPADLCYLHYVPKSSGFFRWWKSSQAYLFPIRGGVLSSANHAAAFLQQFYSTSKKSLSAACYCVYDIFSKSDVRLRLAIPGQTSVEVVSEEGSQSSQDTQVYWLGAYLSSVLRYFNAQSACIEQAPFEKVGDILFLIEQATEFLGNTSQHYQMLLEGISKYLLQHRAFRAHQLVYAPMKQQNPTVYRYIAESYCYQKRVPPSLIQKLRQTPGLRLTEAQVLSLQQPKAAREAVEAHLVQHEPDWDSCVLFAKSFAAEGKHTEALLCVNRACTYLSKLSTGGIRQTVWQKPSYSDCAPWDLHANILHSFEVLAFDTHFLTKPAKAVYKALVLIWRVLGLPKLEALRKESFRDGTKKKCPVNEPLENNHSLTVSWRQCLTGKEALTFRLTEQDPLEVEHPQFTRLFKLFTQDVLAMQQWDLDRETLEEVWLARGSLAMRLYQPKKAALAFKCALIQRTSQFALHSLVKLYSNSGDLEVAAEAFSALLQQAYEQDVYPDWLFATLCKLCCRFGLKALIEQCGGNRYIIQATERLNQWQIHGIGA